MNLSKLSILLFSALFLISCNTDGISDTEKTNDAPVETVSDGYEEAEGVWAKENFDLLAVSNLLNDAEDAAEFEKLINKDDGINNLDLNGDGFVDYISVEEFEDRTDDQRGFTLLSRFGPDDIQEIASIIFGRDRPDRRGATLYVRGNEQIYGNNYNYEGNWLDKSLAIANWAFGDRDNYYRSRYYYDNYPDYYDEYRVIRTPVYRQRIIKYHVNPAMIKITTPTSKIKIKSRYPGRSYRRVHAKMAKPTKEQRVYYKSKPDRFVKEKRKDQRGPDKASKGNGRGKPVDNGAKQNEKPDRKPAKVEPKKVGKPPVQKNNVKKSGKPEKSSKSKGGGKGNGKAGKPGRN